MTMQIEKNDDRKLAKVIGLLVGLGLFVLFLFTPHPGDLSRDAWLVAGVALLMAVFWITEALPLPITAMLPLPIIPMLGVAPLNEVTVSYSHPIIFLFVGGFLVALAMEKWRLHERIALAVLKTFGSKLNRLVGGFAAVTAFLSMWISNTATTLMMIPIALSIIDVVERSHTGSAHSSHKFSCVLLLSIAYGASAGGMATLVGTPPNAFLAGFLKQTHGIEIGFSDWIVMALPLSIVLLGFIWLLLTKILFRIGSDSNPEIRDRIGTLSKDLGPMCKGEKLTAIFFLLLVIGWVFRPWLASHFPNLGLTDTTVAMLIGLSLFLCPVDWRRGKFLMDWEWGKKLPFGILLLFGGGFALAGLIDSSGLATWIGIQLSVLEQMPHIVIVISMIVLLVVLTEITSNTATTATFLPIVSALAITLGKDPLLLTVPAALAASCAFMLPVATPPNTIIFSSGRVGVTDMVKVGFVLNLISVVLITIVSYTLLVWIFLS